MEVATAASEKAWPHRHVIIGLIVSATCILELRKLLEGNWTREHVLTHR